MTVSFELPNEEFTTAEYIDTQRCLNTLFSIRAGSQPLDRDLGIDLDNIAGYPTNVARNMLSLEIIEKVRRYEPRVEVVSVDFKSDENGLLSPQILFKRAEG